MTAETDLDRLHEQLTGHRPAKKKTDKESTTSTTDRLRGAKSVTEAVKPRATGTAIARSQLVSSDRAAEANFSEGQLDRQEVAQLRFGVEQGIFNLSDLDEHEQDAVRASQVEHAREQASAEEDRRIADLRQEIIEAGRKIAAGPKLNISLSESGDGPVTVGQIRDAIAACLTAAGVDVTSDRVDQIAQRVISDAQSKSITTS